MVTIFSWFITFYYTWFTVAVLLRVMCIVAEDTVSDVCWKWAVLLHAISYLLYFRATRSVCGNRNVLVICFFYITEDRCALTLSSFSISSFLANHTNSYATGIWYSVLLISHLFLCNCNDMWLNGTL